MTNDLRSILKNIEAGKIAPVYFFYGDEPYPIDHLVHRLMSSLDPGTRDFNLDTFSGESIDIEGIIAIARSFPMMSSHRLILVRDVQKTSAKDRTRLLTYVQSPMETTCLVLVANRADRRQKFWGGLTQNSVWVESKPFYENQAADWVLQRIQHRKAQMTPDAARLLVEHVGTSLWNLHHEIDKLMTFAWEKTSLDREDVLAVVGMSREYNTWEFTDAVARREPGEALKILVQLMEARQSAVGMIMDLTRRLLILIRIRLLLDRQVAADQIGSLLGLKPYFVKLFIGQAKRFTLEETQNALETLYQADRAVKTGLLDPIMAMTLTVYDMTHKKNRFFNK